MDGRASIALEARREGDTMANADSRVTIHMTASLDGFIARKDGGVDWLETSDEFVDGDTMDPGFVADGMPPNTCALAPCNCR